MLTVRLQCLLTPCRRRFYSERIVSRFCRLEPTYQPIDSTVCPEGKGKCIHHCLDSACNDRAEASVLQAFGNAKTPLFPCASFFLCASFFPCAPFFPHPDPSINLCSHCHLPFCFPSVFHFPSSHSLFISTPFFSSFAPSFLGFIHSFIHSFIYSFIHSFALVSFPVYLIYLPSEVMKLNSPSLVISAKN